MSYNRSFIQILLMVLTLLVTEMAMARVVYVNDELRVGVRPEPDSRVASIDVVKTGMKLELLEERDSFVKIRTEKGVTGWIKGIYITDTPPAVIQLTGLTEKYNKAESKINELSDTIKVVQEANSNLNSRLDKLRDERDKLQLDLAKQQSRVTDSKIGWALWVLLGIALLAGTFWAGYAWHRFNVMQRLGGLRF